jgi:hypothetical protein
MIIRSIFSKVHSLRDSAVVLLFQICNSFQVYSYPRSILKQQITAIGPDSSQETLENFTLKVMKATSDDVMALSGSCSYPSGPEFS